MLSTAGTSATFAAATVADVGIALAAATV